MTEKRAPLANFKSIFTDLGQELTDCKIKIMVGRGGICECPQKNEINLEETNYLYYSENIRKRGSLFTNV